MSSTGEVYYLSCIAGNSEKADHTLKEVDCGVEVLRPHTARSIQHKHHVQ